MRRIRQRVEDLETTQTEIVDDMDELHTSHEVLKRDVRWICGIAMGAAAVVATFISIASQLL